MRVTMTRYRRAKKRTGLNTLRSLARDYEVYNKAKYYAKDRKKQTGQKVTAHTSKGDCLDALILDAGLSRGTITRMMESMGRHSS